MKKDKIKKISLQLAFILLMVPFLYRMIKIPMTDVFDYFSVEIVACAIPILSMWRSAKKKEIPLLKRLEYSSLIIAAVTLLKRIIDVVFFDGGLGNLFTIELVDLIWIVIIFFALFFSMVFFLLSVIFDREP